MRPRINYGKAAPGTYAAMDALDQYVQACNIERAALTWTEAVTVIVVDHVPDAVYNEVQPISARRSWPT